MEQIRTRISDQEVANQRIRAALRGAQGEIEFRRQLYEKACETFVGGDLFVTITDPTATSVDSFEKSLKTALRQLDKRLFGRRPTSLLRLAVIVPSEPRHLHMLVRVANLPGVTVRTRQAIGDCGEDITEDVSAEDAVRRQLKKFFPRADIDIEVCHGSVEKVAQYILFHQEQHYAMGYQSEISSATRL